MARRKEPGSVVSSGSPRPALDGDCQPQDVQRGEKYRRLFSLSHCLVRISVTCSKKVLKGGKSTFHHSFSGTLLPGVTARPMAPAGGRCCVKPKCATFFPVSPPVPNPALSTLQSPAQGPFLVTGDHCGAALTVSFWDTSGLYLGHYTPNLDAGSQERAHAPAQQ